MHYSLLEQTNPSIRRIVTLKGGDGGGARRLRRRRLGGGGGDDDGAATAAVLLAQIPEVHSDAAVHTETSGRLDNGDGGGIASGGEGGAAPWT